MAIYCQERRVLMEIPTPQPKTSAGIRRRSYLDALNYRGASTPNLRNNSIPSNQDLYSESSDSSLSDDGFESSLHIGDHFERRQRLAFYSPASEFQVNSSYITEPSLKKQRISNKEEVGLQFQLESLSQQKQLVEVVNSLVILEEEQKTLPFPNLKPLQEELQLKKANVYRSIPYTRLGSNRDAHCYRKACPQLLAFKKTCIGRGQLLLQCNLWESALEFVLNAWRFTSELPQWETSSHNRCKEQCFSALAAQCTTALQQSSIGMKRAIELKRRLKIARTHSKLIIPCIQELDSIIENLQCRTAET